MKDFLYINDFLPNHESLFNSIKSETVWDERMKARKTASFGVAYNYSQIKYADCAFPNALENINEQVHKVVGFKPNNCLLNFYPDGQSSMGFHSDTATGRTTDTGVAIISLGAPREMLFKHKFDSQRTSSRLLCPGSLIYLDDLTQQEWLHAIPKAANSGPRISLSFRSIEVD